MERTSHDYVVLKRNPEEDILACQVRGLKALTRWWQEKVGSGPPILGGKKNSTRLLLASRGAVNYFDLSSLDVMQSVGIDYSDWDDNTWFDMYHPVHVIELDVQEGEDVEKALAEFKALVQTLLKEKNLESQAFILPNRFVSPYVHIFTSLEISEQIVQANLLRFKAILTAVPPYFEVEDPR